MILQVQPYIASMQTQEGRFDSTFQEAGRSFAFLDLGFRVAKSFFVRGKGAGGLVFLGSGLFP